MEQSEQDPLRVAAERVGDRWTLLILDALRAGPQRFSDLRELVQGIAPNTLSSRLDQLEAEGLVLATPYQQRPERHAYQLTERGRDLGDALDLLRAWAAEHGPDEHRPRHDVCGTSLEVQWHCPACGVEADATGEQVTHL